MCEETYMHHEQYMLYSLHEVPAILLAKVTFCERLKTLNVCKLLRPYQVFFCGIDGISLWILVDVIICWTYSEMSWGCMYFVLQENQIFLKVWTVYKYLQHFRPFSCMVYFVTVDSLFLVALIRSRWWWNFVLRYTEELLYWLKLWYSVCKV